MAYVVISAVAQVEQHMLREGGYPVMAGAFIDQGKDIKNLGPIEVVADLDVRHNDAAGSSSGSRVETVASSGRAGTKR